MLATSTHDTKRSEDVRARLAVLSEIPGAWEDAVWRWAHRNEGRRADGLPDRNAEYLVYQSVVGSWPISTERLVAYMEKASKEAKAHTSWVDPAPEYDDALRAFAGGILADDDFVADVETFLHEHVIVERGRWNSLVQTALKLTCPGVPDLYQGSELWDLSLVDPDNRRPVDYALRRRLLADARELDVDDVARRLADIDDPGTPKLWLIARLLQLRAARPALFDATAGYEPLMVEGSEAERVIAFSRAGGDLVVVCVRYPARGPVDAATAVVLPDGTRREVAALVGPLPVAIVA